MEIFFSDDISGDVLRLNAEESAHCVRVLRHRVGDELSIMDGKGTLYRCRLLDADASSAAARVEERVPGFGSHPYHLTMAVCPTKNIDRFEWFAEKATEIGLDVIAPLIGERSERRILKTERLRRLVLSAAKQSLKAAIPDVREAVSVREFISSVPSILPPIARSTSGVRSVCEDTASASAASDAASGAVLDRHAFSSDPVTSDAVVAAGQTVSFADGDLLTCQTPADLKLICYCSDDSGPRRSIGEVLSSALSWTPSAIAQPTPASCPSSTLSQVSANCPSVIASQASTPCLSATAQPAPASCSVKAQVDNDNRSSLSDIVDSSRTCDQAPSDSSIPRIIIMIGPEGDFSPDEANLAISRGWIPVQLGPSRLRTETAALVAVTAVYLRFL